jgi:uncharacterized membrane protein (DUF2068 family)
MDWSLLSCGVNGHITHAPDQAPLRDRMSVTTREGAAWRCLRCGAFVIGAPDTTGPVSAAPPVRRGKEVRSALILRLFAIERFLRAIVFGVLAYGIWRFKTSRLSIEQSFDRELPALRTLMRQLGFNVNHSKLLGLIHEAFTLNPRTLTWLAAGAAGYAVIEIIEAVGLWLGQRWGEYFAMVVTSVGIPYEIYDLTAKVTVLRVVAFVINLALVLYLVLTKRLFGVRGGKKAYEARLRSAAILQAEIDALAAEAARPAVPDERAGAAPASEPAAVPTVAPAAAPSPAAGQLAPGNAGHSPAAGHPGSE